MKKYKASSYAFTSQCTIYVQESNLQNWIKSLYECYFTDVKRNIPLEVQTLLSFKSLNLHSVKITLLEKVGFKYKFNLLFTDIDFFSKFAEYENKFYNLILILNLSTNSQSILPSYKNIHEIHYLIKYFSQQLEFLTEKTVSSLKFASISKIELSTHADEYRFNKKIIKLLTFLSDYTNTCMLYESFGSFNLQITKNDLIENINLNDFLVNLKSEISKIHTRV